MRVDVSEIKTRRECGRKWALSSRNFYNLKQKVESRNLAFGTIFHEALAAFYLSKGDSAKIEGIIEKYVNKLEDVNEQRMIMQMLTGYAEKVLPEDLKKYKVLDVEYHFKFNPWEKYKYVRDGFSTEAINIQICGSIDLVLLDMEKNQIAGFEHKTCKNFRTEFYNLMDEQPRTYYLALDQYVEEYNKRNGTSCTNGGIYINQVRKLKTRFEHSRLEPIMYTEKDREKFLMSFLRTSMQIQKSAEESKLPPPEPGYMKCILCEFKDVCERYNYMEPTKEKVLNDFSEELEVRKIDHLDEKIQKSGEENNEVQ